MVVKARYSRYLQNSIWFGTFGICNKKIIADFALSRNIKIDVIFFVTKKLGWMALKFVSTTKLAISARTHYHFGP